MVEMGRVNSRVVKPLLNVYKRSQFFSFKTTDRINKKIVSRLINLELMRKSDSLIGTSAVFMLRKSHREKTTGTP